MTLLLTLIAAPSFADQLKSELLPISERVLDGSTEKAKVQFLLKNNADHFLFILKYETPLKGITKNLFEIKCNGESSHFNGTDDYAYGSSACQNLAANNPGQAIWRMSTTIDFQH